MTVDDLIVLALLELLKSYNPGNVRPEKLIAEIEKWLKSRKVPF